MSVKQSLFFLTLLSLAVPAAVGFISTAQTTPASQQAQETIVIPSSETDTTPFEEAETTSVTTISALGTIEANQVAGISFLVSGEVAEVLVDSGDSVNAGDVIARLDSTAAQVAYDQAVLNLERAQISQQQLYEPPTDEAIRAAQANIASAQAAYSEIANGSSSEVQAAQLRYERALNNYNTEVAVRANMNGTEEEIALQDAAVGAASFDLEIARLQLEELQTPDSASLWQAGVRIQQAQLELEQLQAGPDQADIDSAELAVQRAQAQLEDAEIALQRTELIAPISGVVTAVNIEAGQTVTTSTTAIEISDLSQLWLTAPVHEVDVDQLSAGMPATVQMDALPDVEIPATVEQIAWLSTVTDDIVYYDTRFALNTTDSRIRVGMTAEAFVQIES
jgi:HlyD family secretion protein